MGWNDEDDGRQYQVVINHEEQYSVWIAGKEVPAGWKAVGNRAPRRTAWPISQRCGPICGR